MLDDATVTCPHCWEQISLEIDTSVEEQDYIEDCPVCCNPMRVLVRCDDGTLVEATVQSTDG
jgi:hypothetical protein